MLLTKKAVILFNPDQYEKLKQKAKLRGTSVAALIREAAGRIILEEDESIREKKLSAAREIVAGEDDSMEWDQLENIVTRGHLS